MKIAFERRAEGEPDLELVWLLVLLAGGVLAAAWLFAPFPTPACAFRGITGVPCPSCGGTRCLRSLLAGHLAEAATWNPLVFAAAAAALAFAGYAAVVTAFRLPRLRLRSISKAERNLLRLGVAVVFLANWGYVFLRLSRGH